MKSMLLNGLFLAATTLGGFAFASTPATADAKCCGGTACCDKCPTSCADCRGTDCCGNGPACCK
jgi:hypothetical protein